MTLFDELLFRAFKQRLADHLPNRVLPVSTEAPQDILALVDSEYTNIAQLLKPGRRARGDARAKIRTLLALEAHVAQDTKVSDSDVNRVEKGIKAGKTRQQVFPKLNTLSAEISGEGLTVKVKIIKQADALPVRLVRNGEDGEVDAAAVREVDLQKKFHWSPFDLADKLSISRPRATALRGHLGIDKNLIACTSSSSARRSTRATPTTPSRACAKLSPIRTWMRYGSRTAPGVARRPAPRAPSPAAPTPRARRRPSGCRFR